MEMKSRLFNSVMKNQLSNYFWLWMPIVYCLLLSSGYLIVNVLMRSQKENLGSVIYALLFVLFYGLLAAPIMSIGYCKKIRKMSWRKYLCCVYNAIITAMYFTICTFPIDFKGMIYSVLSIPWLSVFFSSLLCGVITLIVYDLKKDSVEQKNYVS